MSTPHLIRLRGPWEFSAGDKTGRISLPGDWLAPLAGFTGEVRFMRRFNRPTGIGPATCVRLMSSGLPTNAQVSLNQTPLAASTNVEITALLATQNRLEIVVDVADSNSTIAGEVWLEIL